MSEGRCLAPLELAHVLLYFCHILLDDIYLAILIFSLERHFVSADTAH